MGWLQRLRDKRREQSFRNGYDYAAGELLRGTSAAEIESYAGSPFLEPHNHFDKGMMKAVSDWEAQGIQRTLQEMFDTPAPHPPEPPRDREQEFL